VSGNEGKPPNVMSIDWSNAQFGCQLGLLAAQMSKSHNVSGVYGLQGVPNITAQAGGFRICATKAAVTGRGFDQTQVAPDLVLTNLIEDWPDMFGRTSDQVKGGKLFGDFVQYGYDTAPVTGASLQYAEGKAFNPNVPGTVVEQLDDMATQFRSGALKIAPTENDARSGS
jgi:basic membrane protein A